MGIKNYASSEVRNYIDCLAHMIKKTKEKMNALEKEKGGFDSNEYNQEMGEWCALINVKDDLDGIARKLVEGSYWQYIP